MGATPRRMAAWQTEALQMPHPFDGLGHLPHLVGVGHQLDAVAEFFAHHLAAADVALDTHAHLRLEARPSIGPHRAAQLAHLLLRVAQPSRRGDVGRVAVAAQFGQALLLAG
jgi:hypothetical protein